MKKTLSICIFMLLTTLLAAQVSKTINVTTAGTLTNLLTSTEKASITNLTVTGNIDARDVKCRRDEVVNLTVLDISATLIVAYSGIDGTSIYGNIVPFSSKFVYLQPVSSASLSETETCAGNWSSL